MKKTAIIGMVSTLMLTGAMALAAEPGTPGGSGMQQEQKGMGMEHPPMKQKHVKKAHSRRKTPEQIKAIQQALNAHGAKLEPDGKWGRETRRAIKDFQKANGMKPTGYANIKTRKALGLSF